MKTLVIIPAYNEAENLERVLNDLHLYLSSYDFIFINDCSNDNTYQLLKALNVPFINLPINLGLAGAVQTGYKYAYENNYDCAIQFDGDGQHQAKYIPKMIGEIEAGADIVIGSRFVDKKKDHSLRMIGSRIISIILRLATKTTINDPTSGMRMLNRKMIYDYAYNMNRKPEPDTLAYQLRKGVKVKEVQVEMNERIAGTSIYKGIYSSVKYMIKMIISIVFLSY